MTVREILDEVIRREGGFVHDPDDSGGATKFGITQQTLSNWRGYDVTIDEVLSLTYDEAIRIYEKKYVEEPGFLPLPNGLRAAVVDFAVNSGPITAIKQLQKALGCTQDGVLGPRTLAAVQMVPVDRLQAELVKVRVRYLAGIVVSQPVKLKFLCGWLNRALTFFPLPGGDQRAHG